MYSIDSRHYQAKRKKFLNRLVALGVILGLFLAASSDIDIQQETLAEYCLMTDRYEASNGQAGWPAYNGTEHCPN